MLIAQAVLSWLLAFGIVNRFNRVVSTVGDFLYRATEPTLGPIRRFLPDLGGIDISPVILIILLIFLDSEMHYYLR
jgi:YggT family protein